MNPSLSPLSKLSASPRHFHRATSRCKVFASVLFLMLALLVSRSAYATAYTVTDTTDSASDTGSLRYAVTNAGDGDAINFASNVVGTIVLTNGTLTISHSVTITGPGAALLAISGGNSNGNNVAFRTNGGTATISQLSIIDNNTVFGGGGSVGSAIYNSGTLTLIACNISTNTAGDGGGAIGNQGTLTVEDSVISGNTGENNSGGGIYNNSGTLTVESSTISGNTTSGNGGGIYNSSGTLTVENSTIANNTAGNGGGIYSEQGLGSGSLTVTNSTISGNSASTEGGVNNSSGTLTVTNSIVSGNTTGDCSACSTTGNLIGGTADLGPLQYNGGITQTMMPLPGSSSVIGEGSGSTLNTDQRGFARSTGGASDLGAVQTNYLTVTTLNDSTDTTTCTGGAVCSLRDAINVANSDGSGDITFQSGLAGTITLTGILPTISTSHVSIAGPAANLLAVDGAGNSAVFDIGGTNAAVNLSGLTIQNGNATSYAAGLSNSGLLFVENCTFAFNTGVDGGGIFNDGILAIENSTFSRNNATNGGGIANTGTLIVENSTFSGNRAYNANGGGLENNGGVMLVLDSTVSGNESLNGGVGAGISIDSGALMVTNSIVSGNSDVNGSTGTEDDCNSCGTQSTANLIGNTTNPNLGALAYNGLNATVQTMLPLPGSPAIQAGDSTQFITALPEDERGFPRLTGGKLDLGAAQTNYTAVQFVQQPTNAIVRADIAPAVTVEVLETNTTSNATDAVDGVPITLTFSGSGTLGGTLTQTSAGGGASFGDLNVNAAGTGDTLATAPITVSSGLTLPAVTSNPFDITLITPMMSFSSAPPTSVIYGVSPITLSATATSSGSSTGQTITYQVDSGPGTISGNVLTITGVGTVVVEADAAVNGSYSAADATANIVVNQANLTVTAANATRAYGAANPIFTGTYIGAVNGDTFNVSGTTTATAASAVGNYPIAPTATGTNLADYSVTYVNGTLAVSQANLTVTAANATRAYGAANPIFTGTYMGTVNGDTFNVSGTTTATAASAVGNYPIAPTATGTNLADYSVTYVNGTLAVSQTNLTVTAANATRVYGTPNPAFSGAVTGAANGDMFTESFTTAATQSSNAGSYAIVPTVAGTDLTDYSVTASNGTLTITQAASKLTLTASSSQVSTGTPVTLTATAASTTTGTPTGTVTFSSGSSQLGTAALNAQGVATLTVTTLPVGSNIVTAGYAGDTNFTGSQAQLSGAVVIGSASFTMTSNISSLAIEPGHAGEVTLTLTPMFGYSGTVTFGCSGLPVNSQCRFQPESITLSGSTPVTVPLLIEIGPLGLKQTGNNAARLHRSSPMHGLPLLLPAVIFWLPGTELILEDRKKQSNRKTKSKSRRMVLLIALLAVSAGMLGLSGCEGLSPFNSNNNPPAGLQTITITATGAGNVSQSIAVQVTVE